MTINDNSTKSINAAIIDLQNQIKQLQHKIDILSKNQLKEDDIEFPGKVEYADEAGKAKEADHAKTADTAKYTSETENAVHAGYADIATKATQDGSGNVITDTYATKTELTSGLAGKSDTGHTHTKSQITDFPTSLPANGGTANYANVPTGFEKKFKQDSWGNQDGVFITDWRTHATEEYGNGDISFRHNKGQLNVIIDGVFYQNEGKYKLVDENSIKTIMKPNYTTGRLPAGMYSSGQTVSISASITTTRGNPVFISYFGDFNSYGFGDTVPWLSFNLYADDQMIQRTVVDNSSAISSDNTSFAGSALAVLSAGSHTIRLDVVLAEGFSGKIQFQEQENYVNLVAFEL